MMDFNFFDPYINVETKPDRKRLILMSVSLLLLVLLAGYQVFMTFSMNKLNTEMADLNAFINAQETQRKITEIQNKQTKEATLQQAITDLQTVSAVVLLTDQVNATLIEDINKQTPDNLFLTELSITSGIISLKGYATQYDTVAQFAHNLRSISAIGEVMIPTVTEDNGNYGYSILAQLVLEGLNESK